MIEFQPLLEFSRMHCVAICAALVPMNLMATTQTLIFAGTQRSFAQVGLMAGVASLYALMMVLHVLTWLLIGVVMVPTYILLGLGTLCLTSNGLAIAYRVWRSQSRPTERFSLRFSLPKFL